VNCSVILNLRPPCKPWPRMAMMLLHGGHSGAIVAAVRADGGVMTKMTWPPIAQVGGANRRRLSRRYTFTNSAQRAGPGAAGD
jgi:hypothetical protein